MDNFNQHNSNGNLPNTTPKQGKKILIVIAIVLVALIGGGLILP